MIILYMSVLIIMMLYNLYQFIILWQKQPLFIIYMAISALFLFSLHSQLSSCIIFIPLNKNGYSCLIFSIKVNLMLSNNFLFKLKWFFSYCVGSTEVLFKLKSHKALNIVLYYLITFGQASLNYILPWLLH